MTSKLSLRSIRRCSRLLSDASQRTVFTGVTGRVGLNRCWSPFTNSIQMDNRFGIPPPGISSRTKVGATASARSTSRRVSPACGPSFKSTRNETANKAMHTGGCCAAAANRQDAMPNQPAGIVLSVVPLADGANRVSSRRFPAPVRGSVVTIAQDSSRGRFVPWASLAASPHSA